MLLSSQYKYMSNKLFHNKDCLLRYLTTSYHFIYYDHQKYYRLQKRKLYFLKEFSFESGNIPNKENNSIHYFLEDQFYLSRIFRERSSNKKKDELAERQVGLKLKFHCMNNLSRHYKRLDNDVAHHYLCTQVFKHYCCQVCTYSFMRLIHRHVIHNNVLSQWFQ